MRVGRIDRKSHFSVALITCYFGLRRFVYTRRIDLLRPCRADVPLTSRKASAGAFCMWRGSRRWLPLGRALESASTGTPPEEAIRPWLVVTRWRIRSLPFAAQIARDDAVVAIDCD